MDVSLVTILGDSYFEPITTLFEKLENLKDIGSNEIQAGGQENGFASGIAILSAVCLESYVMRVRYANSATQDQLDNVKVSAYLKSIFPKFKFEKEIIEIFILRDVLAHNHLWEIDARINEDGDLQQENISKRSNGNKKYKHYVNESVHKTKNLELNVNPIKVGFQDIRTVFKSMWKILLFLESQDRSQVYVSSIRVTYKEKRIKFEELVNAL